MDKRQAGIFAFMAAIILALTGFIVFKEINESKNSEIVLVDNYSHENHDGDSIIGSNVSDSASQYNEDQPAKIKVYITGQVRNPGVIKVEEGSRLIDVIEKAGGPLEDADLLRVNLAIKVKDEGMYIIS